MSCSELRVFVDGRVVRDIYQGKMYKEVYPDKEKNVSYCQPVGVAKLSKTFTLDMELQNLVFALLTFSLALL